MPARLIEDSVIFWNVEEAKRVASILPGSSATDIVLSRNGDKLAVASLGGNVRIIHTGIGGTVERIRIGVSALAVCWLYDGERVAAGTTDGSIRILDSRSGVTVGEFNGHTDSVLSISSFPSGKTLCTASGETS